MDTSRRRFFLWLVWEGCILDIIIIRRRGLINHLEVVKILQLNSGVSFFSFPFFFSLGAKVLSLGLKSHHLCKPVSNFDLTSIGGWERDNKFARFHISNYIICWLEMECFYSCLFLLCSRIHFFPLCYAIMSWCAEATQVTELIPRGDPYLRCIILAMP